MREAKAIYSELLRAKGLASVTCAGRGSEEGGELSSGEKWAQGA